MNRLANAGAYCHRENAGGVQKSVLWFSDEMTPRYDWTWNGGGFFATAAIRYYCWRRCVCTQNRGKDNSTSKIWKFVTDFTLFQSIEGAVQSQQISNPQNTRQILPPQNVPNPPAGTCGSDGKQFCSLPWPSEYGPIPRSPPDTTDVIRPDPTFGANLTVCGNKCNGPQDCVPSNGIENCYCAIPSYDDVKTLGLDPLYPAAVCLVLLKIMDKTALTNIHFGMRSLKTRYVDGAGFPYVCRCNETFSAQECCGSRDGKIWFSDSKVSVSRRLPRASLD